MAAFTNSLPIVTSGLVLYLDARNPVSYPKGGTTWSDLSRNNNNGTLVNGPTYDSSNEGSVVFDGTNDYMTFLSSSNYSYGTGDFSVDYWINFNNLTSTQQALLDASSNPIANTTSGGTFGFAVNNTQIITYANNGSLFTTTNTSLSANTWINLSFSRISGVLYVYRNSMIIDSVACAWDFQFNSTIYPFLYVGVNPGTNASLFNGKLGNVKIYKGKGLIASEILQNYNAQKSRFGL